MRKVVIVVLLLMVIMGCSSKPVVEKDFLYFLFATPLKEHTIWLQAKEGFTKACSDFDIKCDWKGPATIDTERMNQTIETGIAQNADAIITQGVVDPVLLEEAYARNIPVMLVDSDIEDANVFGYMGKDFTLQAELLLADIEKKYGEDELLRIAIQVAEKEFTIAKDQIREIESVFEKHPGGFEIVSISESKSDSIRAKKTWESVLTDHNINIAINFAGESAVPCAEVAQHMKIRDNLLIYGVDSMEDTISAIREGDIDGSIVVSFFDYGYMSVKMMYEAIQKSQAYEKQTLGAKMIMVTKENIHTYAKELTIE